MGDFFERQVEIQRARRDPLSRLPWQVNLVLAGVILGLGLLQTVYGTGLSRVLGLALLLVIGPTSVLGAFAAREARRRSG